MAGIIPANQDIPYSERSDFDTLIAVPVDAEVMIRSEARPTGNKEAFISASTLLGVNSVITPTKRITAMLLGHSMVAEGNIVLTNPTMTASGGKITITHASLATTSKGARLAIVLHSNSALNTTHFVSDYISSTSCMIPDPVGNLSGALTEPLVQLKMLDVQTDLGWFNHLNRLYGGIFDVKYNFGASAQTVTDYLLPLASEAFFAENPVDVIMIDMIRNDIIASGYTASATFTALQTVITRALKYCKFVFVCTSPPDGAVGYTGGAVSGWTVAKYEQLLLCNQLIRNWARQTDRVILIDQFNALVDAANFNMSTATRNYIGSTEFTTAIRDGIHPTTFGYYRIAKDQAAPALSTLLSKAGWPARFAPNDHAFLKPTSKNLNPNPCFLGSGGSGTGVTGTIPDFINMPAGANTVSTTISPADDGFGNKLVINCSAPGAGSFTVSVFPNGSGNLVSTASGFVGPTQAAAVVAANTGKRMRACCNLKVVSVTNNCARHPYLFMQGFYGGGWKTLAMDAILGQGTATQPIVGEQLTLATPAFTISQTDMTFIKADVQVVFRADGNIVYELSNFFIEIVD